MTETRGETVNIWARVLLNYEKVKTVQADKKWMITQFYLYTLAYNLKRNLKKQFPFNTVSINEILCRGCDEDDKAGTPEILHNADTFPRHMHRHSIATERLRLATPRNASSVWNEDSMCITKGWKVVAKPWEMPGFLASREEFNPGPVTKLDRSELLCHTVLLKYKRDRESCLHRLPPASL